MTADPTLTVRIDWARAGVFTGALDDVSARLLDGASWTRGRNADLTGEATGAATFTLSNHDDRFTPDRQWCDNPSFEGGTAGWSAAAIASLTAAATSITQVTDNATADTGTKAGEAVLTATSDSGVAYAIPYTFRSGVTYAVSVYLKSVSGNLNVRAGLASAGTPADIASSAANITTAWAAYAFTWTPSADRTDAVFFVRTTTAATATVRIDAVQVNPGTTANTYIEAPTKGQLVPGRPVHAYATYDSTDYPAFFGYIQRLAIDAHDPRSVTVTCYDVLQVMAETDVVVAANAYIARCARDLRVAVLDDFERGDRNLVVNPEFATDMTGWSATYLTRYTDDGPLAITTCAELSVGAGRATSTQTYLAPVFFAGQYYRGSVYLRSVGTVTTVELTMTTVAASRTITVTPPTTWTRYTVEMSMSVTRTASEGGANTNPVLEVENTGAYAVRLSAASITRGQALYPYSSTGAGRWPNWCGNGSFDAGARNGWLDGWANICTNPSFETNTTGWAVSADAFHAAATSITRDGTRAAYGSYSAILVMPATADTGCHYTLSGTFKSGVAYTARLKVWIATAGGFSFRIGLGSQGTPADYAVSASTALVNATWVAASVTWTPSGDRTDAHFWFEEPAGGGLTLTLDGLSVIRRDYALTTDPGYTDTGIGGGGSFPTTRTTSTTAKYGGISLSYALPATATAGAGYDFSHYGGYFLSGRSYTLSLWVNPSSSMPYKVGMGADKLDGTWDESTAATGTASANTWTQITSTWTPSADRSSLTPQTVMAYLYQTDATARTVLIDGVRVIPGSSADDFEMAHWSLAAGAEVTDQYTSSAAVSGSASSALSTINQATLSRHWIEPALATPFYSYVTAERGTAPTSSESFTDDITDMTRPEIDRDGIINVVNVDGYYYADETSVDAYGMRPGSVTWGYYATATREAVAADVLARYKDPRIRPTITVTDRWPSQFAREVSDVVTLTVAREMIYARPFSILSLTTRVDGGGWTTSYVLEEL